MKASEEVRRGSRACLEASDKYINIEILSASFALVCNTVLTDPSVA